MNPRQLFSQLFLSDPALRWMREQDAPRARRTFVYTTIIVALLTPFLSIQPSSYEAINPAKQIHFVGMGASILLIGLFLTISWASQKPFFFRFSSFELASWTIIVILFSQLGYFMGVAKIGHPMLADPALATRWMESLAQNKPKAALVAWMSVAFAALAMIISTRAAPSKPLPHALFVLAAIVLIIYEDKVFDTIRNAVTFLWVCGIVISFANWSRYNTLAKAYAEHCCRESDVVQQTVLLSSFLTPAVHEKVKRNERVADSFSNLTVIFADMVGFTALSRRISPGHLVDVLNEIFAAGDEIAAACGIEKVKTIGDCYMAVTGGIASPERGAADAIGFAQRYLKKVEEVSQRLDIPLALRVGIHTGPAVGGIIGTSRPAYDYWGDTVNLASRLESASGAGRILVSESTWLQTKRDFEFEAGNDIEVKGVGSVRSHFIAKALLEDNIVPLVKRSN